MKKLWDAKKWLRSVKEALEKGEFGKKVNVCFVKIVLKSVEIAFVLYSEQLTHPCLVQGLLITQEGV